MDSSKAPRWEESVLRRATVQFCVFEREDVHRAFVTGGAEEGRVVTEVDAEETEERR